MDHELQQLIDEQNKDEFSDDQDLVSQMDIEDFEQRLHTSQSFVREKPPQHNSRAQSGMTQTGKPQPQSLKDLNEKMQQNLAKKQVNQQTRVQGQQRSQQQFSQTQQVQKKQDKRKSVEPRANNNPRQVLEQAQRDNQELLQKLGIMKRQLQSLEAENAELKQEIQRKGNSSGFLPKIEQAGNSELKLLRMENEELKRIIQKQNGSDSGKMLQMYGLQVVKLKCRIEELTQQLEKQ
ncbi:unnamed protein product [Paramecium pentaurelia]|uniref:Uncharacterized protein n=1 Tax=Paramecium pentaurelia TaxID=43138 RepID=A0A8S1WK63_9CILI|nr:unnamed protein product [Paramecium pentaurelia]